MESKLYVGNLSYDTTEDELRSLFGQAGAVEAVEVIKDRDTGSSKGFAFITMASAADAEKAISTLDGQALGNRNIRVSVARPREERPGGGGGGRYGGPGGGGPGRGGGGDRDRRGGGGNRRY